MRKLSDCFMSALMEGILNPLLQLVKRYVTLCLDIRENYINIFKALKQPCMW